MEEVNSEYDFILNPGQKPKPAGSGKKTKILLIIAIVALLAMGGILGYSFLTNRNKASASILLGLAQKQTEIIRIINLALQKSNNPDTKALASTIGFSVTTSEVQMEGLIKAQGTKVSPQLLGAGKDASTDTKLNNAGLNNTFDQVFKEVITAKLTDYQTSLKTAHAQISDAKAKQLLVSSSNQVAVILNQK